MKNNINIVNVIFDIYRRLKKYKYQACSVVFLRKAGRCVCVCVGGLKLGKRGPVINVMYTNKL